MAERTFFVRGDVRVTESAFETPAVVHPISEIKSVYASRKDPSRVGPIVTAIVGAAAVVAGRWGLIAAAVIIAFAILWWMTQKPLYSVVVRSPVGEKRVFFSKDRMFVHSITGAVNDALVEQRTRAG
jgi:hypothetical protein